MAKTKQASFKKRAEEALATAQDAAQTAKRWTDVHNAVFGIEGAAGRLFKTKADRTAFSQTEQYQAIANIIEELRDGDLSAPPVTANGTVIVRLPRSIHAALLSEADAEGVSLNQLCVSKLSMQLGALV